MERVLVSILCTVYNHEKYLEKTINSFLQQKTSFRFEILLHDDASTDGSAEIMKKYEKEYPDCVRCIYQKENQYQKGVWITLDILLPLAKGKYIAICEGDDYWIDCNKLELQVSWMERHPDCLLTVHDGKICYEDGIEKEGSFSPYCEDRDVPIEEIATRWLFPTASFVYRAGYLKDKEAMPFAKDAPCGDVPVVLYFATKGKVHYFNKCMSVYRLGASSSVTYQWSKNKDKQINVNERFIRMLDRFDVYTNYQYADYVDEFRKDKEFNNLLLKRDLKTIKTQRYEKYYKKASVLKRMKVLLRIFFPKLVKNMMTIADNIHHWRMKSVFKA